MKAKEIIDKLTVGIPATTYRAALAGHLPPGWYPRPITAILAPGQDNVMVIAVSAEDKDGSIVGSKFTAQPIDWTEDDLLAIIAQLGLDLKVQAGMKPPRKDPQLRIVNKSGYPLTYATDGSVGLDLRAVIGVERDVAPGRRWLFDTGIHIELPAGCAGLVQPRSGMARDHGVFAVTGTIDRDYRGAVKALLVNPTSEAYRVHPGDRIAQLVIVRAPRVEVVELKDGELSETARGDSGFGSTGR